MYGFNSLSASNNASKCRHKLCYGKIMVPDCNLILKFIITNFIYLDWLHQLKYTINQIRIVV